MAKSPSVTGNDLLGRSLKAKSIKLAFGGPASNYPMKKPVRVFSLVAACCLLCGCANPEIVKLSPDTYMLTRVDHGGIFGNASALKAGVIRDADTFAASQGKVAIPVEAKETPMVPGYYGHPGTFASFEYQFRVVDESDPEARRTSLTPRPNVVIEKTEKISSDIHTKDETEKKPDLYTEIIKLDDLRKRGLITDAEYEAQKQKLLNAPK